jgi:hypothetical protein
VRRQAQESGALRERLSDQAHLALLEVSKPAMDQPAGAGAGAGGDVLLLDERHLEAARHRVEQRPGAHDPATHDEQVPALVRETGEVRGAALERAGHRSALKPSVGG